MIVLTVINKICEWDQKKKKKRTKKSGGVDWRRCFVMNLSEPNRDHS